MRPRAAAPLLIVAILLVGCAGANPPPTLAPLASSTPAEPTGPTALAIPTAPPSTPVAALPFPHTPCAPGVDLTGQTITFYHLSDAPNQLNQQTLPPPAGFDDATAYFNAHGGLCGAALAQSFPGPVRGQFNGQAEYDALAAQNPRPPLVGIYDSTDAESLREQLAADQIPALGPLGTVLALYGPDGRSPGWIFGLVPAYPNQLGSFCRYVAQHPRRFPDPVIGYLSWIEQVGTVQAYRPEALAYCDALGVKVLAAPAYFATETTFINTTVQSLVDAGANIIYTDSRGTGPVRIATTLASMGLQGTVTLAAANWGLDASVGLLGQGAPGAGGLPPTNALLGSLPLRSWAERDHPGIQLLTDQADLHQRTLADRDTYYLLGWVETDLFIEAYIETGNRAGYHHVTGAEMKATLENMVYAPLGGLLTINYQHGARRDVAADRIGQLAYLGRDGQTAAGPNNLPLLVLEAGQERLVPLLEPLTDLQPAPDLRPGSADVPATVATEPTATPSMVVTSTALAALSVTGRLAFVSDRDGNPEIYAMNADGSGLLRLTNNPANDTAPAWSPDGRKIAFTSDRDGNLEIYVMNADGSDQTNLTRNAAVDEQPAWSPDGSQIAFGSERDGNHEVYVMNADGSQVSRLTRHPAFDELPNWSPDGSKIAFTTDRDGNIEVYVMNADGTNPQRLTNNPAQDAFPSWSPDGSRLAFWSDRTGNGEIFVMPAPGSRAQLNADGTPPTDLTNNPAEDVGKLAWSPDGRYIAFSSDRGNGSQIYVMQSDGHDQTALTDGPGQAYDISWQP